MIGGIFYIKRKPTQVIEETELAKEKPEKIETANWKTYRNEEYGFEIKYPVDWYVETEINPASKTKLSVSFENYPSEGGVEKEDYQLIIFAIEEESIIQWLKKAKETVAKIEEFTVNSEKGYKATIPKVGISAVIVKNKYLYSLIISFPSAQGEKIFDQMLSTLRFLEK
jgi:hypothetical protein